MPGRPPSREESRTASADRLAEDRGCSSCGRRTVNTQRRPAGPVGSRASGRPALALSPPGGAAGVPATTSSGPRRWRRASPAAVSASSAGARPALVGGFDGARRSLGRPAVARHALVAGPRPRRARIRFERNAEGKRHFVAHRVGAAGYRPARLVAEGGRPGRDPSVDVAFEGPEVVEWMTSCARRHRTTALDRPTPESGPARDGHLALRRWYRSEAAVG